jgi:hypothetical protein
VTVMEYMETESARVRIRRVARAMRENHGWSYRKSVKEAALDVRRFAELVYGEG